MKNKAIRCYTLRLYANPGKARQAFANMVEYRAWLWDYVMRYYSKAEGATESTKGRGWIANQAFKRARGILLAGRNGSIATGEWFNRPKSLPLLCDGTLEENKSSSFDYWAKLANGPRLPAQTHRALKNALRKGGKLLKTCEVAVGRNGGLFVRAFVEFEKPEPTKSRDYIGVDVGVNAGIARSDGYIGKDLHPMLARNRQKRDEQRRQGHVKSSKRSAVKQILDREAKRLVTLAARGNKTLVLERLSTLSQLRMHGSIGAWPRLHLGMRVSQFAELAGVDVLEASPAYTSQTCLVCGHRDRKNRCGIRFRCRRCGYIAHADTVGAVNLARKARGIFPRRENEKAAKTNTRLLSERSCGGVS